MHLSRLAVLSEVAVEAEVHQVPVIQAPVADQVVALQALVVLVSVAEAEVQVVEELVIKIRPVIAKYEAIWVVLYLLRRIATSLRSSQ